MNFRALFALMLGVAILATSAIAVVPAVFAAHDKPIDPASGFIKAEGWETVKGTCTACHSSRLVIQNRGNKSVWLERIRWMQQKQGLWNLGPAEPVILNYLAENYGEPSEVHAAEHIDPDTGFAIAKGWETVKGTCTACHSSRLVIQNRGTRQVWLDRVRMMQEEHGLWDLGPNEPVILDYLVENYGPMVRTQFSPSASAAQ